MIRKLLTIPFFLLKKHHLQKKKHHLHIKKHHFPIKNTSKILFSYQNPPFSHQKHLKNTIFPSKTPISHQISSVLASVFTVSTLVVQIAVLRFTPLIIALFTRNFVITATIGAFLI
jgi:hypothetical protein